MNYHFKIHKEKDGYWTECCELAGCVTQGDTTEQLFASAKEALNLYLEESENSNVVFPLPDENLNAQKKLMTVPVEPETALAVLLRNQRLNEKLTQKQAAEMLGVKNIYSYQRLEKKPNPTLKMMKRIHASFPGIKLERVFG